MAQFNPIRLLVKMPAALEQELDDERTKLALELDDLAVSRNHDLLLFAKLTECGSMWIG